MPGVQALILDYGDVLSWPQSIEIIEDMARRVGASAEAFRAAYRQHRDPYDAGVLSATEFWRQVLGTLGWPSGTPDLTVEWLIQRDVESWTHYRDEVWALARSFRSTGRRTAMLSNCPPEILTRIRADRPLESWFDVIVVSCQIGRIKPDPQIYHACLSDLGARADHVLFVDDRAVNLEAAARLGIQTLHFAGDNPVRNLRVRLRTG